MKNNIKKYMAICAVIGCTIVVGCGSNNDSVEQDKPSVENTENPSIDSTVEPESSSDPSADMSDTSDESDEDTQSEVEKEDNEVDNEVKDEEVKQEADELESESNDIAPVIGEVDPTIAQEIVYVATNGVELPDGGAMSMDMFAKTYGISTEGLSSYYIHIPMKSSYSTEIAVFEVKNDATKKAVLEGIQKRQEGLLTQFKNGSAEQYKLVENYRIEEKGNTIIFVVSDQADKIVEQFLNM